MELQYKVLFCLFLTGGLIFGYEAKKHTFLEQGEKIGRDAVQANWDADKEAKRMAEQKAVADRLKENQQIRIENETKNQKVLDEQSRKFKQKSKADDLTIAALRAHGGLRLSASVCEGFARKANPQSTEGNYGTGSIRLPARVEDGLFELARKADGVVIRLQACQMWIKENGFSP